MKKTLTRTAWLVPAVLGVLVLPALARDFRVAGGIQYVIQATREKEKGNLEDANRLYRKAVMNLSLGVANDPKDDEAWVYLAQAYGELGVADSAGWAFDEALKRIAEDPKLSKRTEQNREHYWVVYFNEGLTQYRAANDILPVDQIQNSADEKGKAAKAKLAEAEVGFRKAVAVMPTKAKAYDNLAIVLALQGKVDEANTTVNEAIAKCDPNDPDLEKIKERKDALYSSAVSDKIKAGDYAGALDMLDGILTKTPNDPGVLTRAAQVSFEQGQKLEAAGDTATARASFVRAAGYFGRASQNAVDEQAKLDLAYNQAVAAQNGGDFKQAAQTAFALVQQRPKDRVYHQLLRGSYDRMGSKKKADDQVWPILGLQDTAAPVSDVAAYTATLPKASAAAKALAEQGAPEDVRQFVSGDTKIDVWYYWTKKLCFAFSAGQKVGSANFGEFGPENGDTPEAAPAGKPAPKKAPAKPATGSKG